MSNFYASIILPTYNSFKLKRGSLEITLASLFTQSIKYDSEIVIVDNGSDDHTSEYISSLLKKSGKFTISSCYCPRTGNRSSARNLGASLSKGKNLIFIDDDIVFASKNDLQKGLENMKSGIYCCASKRLWTHLFWSKELVLEGLLKGNYDYLYEISFEPRGIKRETGFRDLFEFSFIANFGLISRKDFERAGGFDIERFDGWGREDVDLMLRLHLAGVEFRSLHNIVTLFHLNHPLQEEEINNRFIYFTRYEKRERELGYKLKVNHLFGVFEGDGETIFEPYNSSK